MANKTLSQLTAKTYPADADYMVLEDTEDTKKIDYEKLASAILDKLTSKTFTVAGSSQTLIAAINALNSNFDGMISKTVNSWDQAVTAAKNANYKMVSVVISGTDSGNLPTGNNTHWGIIYCNSAGTYGGVMLQAFDGNLYTRGLTSGNWSTWKTVTSS